ncbi:PilW family protein [Thalassotalea ponticola]|uniref:PilW family protein n=1 Tax=Thalassotalea ponticola TaxID=1523392 RepID=UPI0025B4534D|nr:PilW family protein [Thalassotalea ponticola]MDN3651703.1 PilW family protein [Thalassotalea ponticola]
MTVQKIEDKKARCNDRLIKGISLVELMISLSLGLFILSLAVSSLVAVNKRAHYHRQLNDISETARFAFALIAHDIKEVRYWRTLMQHTQLSGSAYISTISDECLANSRSWSSAIQQTVFVVNDGTQNYPCIAQDGYIHGDILTLRGVKHELPTAFNANHLYVKTNGVQSRFYFGKDSALSSNTLNSGTQHQVFTHSYYIGDSNQLCHGLPIPSLFWQTVKQGLPTPEELLRGVEHLQVTLGLDLDGDMIIDNYQVADSNTNWPAVRSIEVELLVRSLCRDREHVDKQSYLIGNAVYSVNDNFYRQRFKKTFLLY